MSKIKIKYLLLLAGIYSTPLLANQTVTFDKIREDVGTKRNGSKYTQLEEYYRKSLERGYMLTHLARFKDLEIYLSLLNRDSQTLNRQFESIEKILGQQTNQSVSDPFIIEFQLNQVLAAYEELKQQKNNLSMLKADMLVHFCSGPALDQTTPSVRYLDVIDQRERHILEMEQKNLFENKIDTSDLDIPNKYSQQVSSLNQELINLKTHLNSIIEATNKAIGAERNTTSGLSSISAQNMEIIGRDIEAFNSRVDDLRKQGVNIPSLDTIKEGIKNFTQVRKSILENQNNVNEILNELAKMKRKYDSQPYSLEFTNTNSITIKDLKGNLLDTKDLSPSYIINYEMCQKIQDVLSDRIHFNLEVEFEKLAANVASGAKKIEAMEKIVNSQIDGFSKDQEGFKDLFINKKSHALFDELILKFIGGQSRINKFIESYLKLALSEQKQQKEGNAQSTVFRTKDWIVFIGALIAHKAPNYENQFKSIVPQGENYRQLEDLIFSETMFVGSIDLSSKKDLAVNSVLDITFKDQGIHGGIRNDTDYKVHIDSLRGALDTNKLSNNFEPVGKLSITLSNNSNIYFGSENTGPLGEYVSKLEEESELFSANSMSSNDYPLHKIQVINQDDSSSDGDLSDEANVFLQCIRAGKRSLLKEIEKIATREKTASSQLERETLASWHITNCSQRVSVKWTDALLVSNILNGLTDKEKQDLYDLLAEGKDIDLKKYRVQK